MKKPSDVFDEIDTDHDGSVTVGELRASIMKELHLTGSWDDLAAVDRKRVVDEANSMLKIGDENGDQVVTRDEWVKNFG